MPRTCHLAAYVHDGRVAAVVELACDDPTLLSHPEIARLGRELAQQVAAMAPAFVSRSAVEPGIVERERQIAEAVGRASQLESFYRDACLLDQAFILEPSLTVAQHIEAVSSAIGGDVSVTRIWRYVAGAA